MSLNWLFCQQLASSSERRKAVLVDCSSSYSLTMEAVRTTSLAKSFLSRPPLKLMIDSLVPNRCLNILSNLSQKHLKRVAPCISPPNWPVSSWLVAVASVLVSLRADSGVSGWILVCVKCSSHCGLWKVLNINWSSYISYNCFISEYLFQVLSSSSSPRKLYRGSFYPWILYSNLFLSLLPMQIISVSFISFKEQFKFFSFPWRFLKVCLILVVNSEIQEKVRSVN